MWFAEADHQALDKEFMAKALAPANDDLSSKPQGKLTNTASPVPGQVAGNIQKMRDFLQDVRGEMRKVVTPSRAEVQSTTIVVLVTVFAFAGYFYLVDSILGRGIQAVLHWMGASQ
ncbi:Preprotein translocase subunit SecE [Acidisarcina polymorpha]|uniref:Protein translocase subunit SecE n=1 Tax=Acidisarcina polymorpha TaxID=2211140 RepID=A0A2Z5FVC6_9BACT|nr:preprotein translocase subunit SecE [Acidisarcina polymorpha]AXC10818.1 Preprotein translocase subunit SecE [Acidisarcina polymorpha]